MTPVAEQPQNMQALQEANRVKSQRARDKRRLRLGLLDAHRLLEQPDWATATVASLLTAQRGWGDHRAERLLQQVPMSSGRLCGELTARQRDRVRELTTGASS